MPAISKIRFTNIVYENGAKRYNDSVFSFDGHNGAIVLENGGGKTVFIQTAIQAVLPHEEVAGRKMKDTLSLENGPAHVAIEWILAEKPRRRYAVTCVTLYMSPTGLDSIRYVYEYGERDDHSIARLPFTKESGGGKRRVTEKGEIQEYYSSMQARYPLTARTFDTIKGFHAYIETQLHIIPSEWEAIVKINSNEGGIEAFFDDCKTTSQLVDRLLIPTIEHSMEGYKQGTFVDLFQVQRDGFKQYKELKEKIEENRRILAELNQYVRGYELLHRGEGKYADLRREAKAYLLHATRQEQEQTAEQERLKGRLESWQTKRQQWQQKEASLRIALERQKEGALETVLHEIENEQEKRETRLSEAKRRYYSLQYAEHREHAREAEARLDYLTEQLGRLEQSQDEQELQSLWVRNGSELRALFVKEEARQRQLMDLQQEAVQRLEGQRQEVVAGKAEAERDREQWLAKEAGIVAEFKEKQGQRQEIAKRILSNPQSQSVEEQLPLWLQEQQALEEAFLQHQRSLTDGERRKGELQLLLQAAKSDQLEVLNTLTKQQEQQEQYAREHQAVKAGLALLRPSWDRIVSVHEKASSLLDQLADELERKQSQKSRLLHKERLAFRHVDDYSDQAQFFADPEVARLVQQWSHQFTLLELGVQYAENLALDHADALWSVTLVTTVQEKPQLQRRLGEVADRLLYPIRVLSTEEIKALRLSGDGHEEASVEASWVEPALWQQVQHREPFLAWKQSVRELAGKAEQARQQQELELAKWQDAQNRLGDFLTRYSLAAVQELEVALAGLRERQLRLAERIAQDDKELQLVDRQKDELQAAILLNRQQLQQLEYHVEQGMQHKQLGERLHVLETELHAVQDKLKRSDRHVALWQRRLEEWQQELDRSREEWRAAKDKLQRLLEDDLYAEVESFEPIETLQALPRLKEERKGLDLQRHRIMKERSELEQEAERRREKKMASEREMYRLTAAHMELVDTELELPTQVDARLSEALKDYKALEEKVQSVQAELTRQNKAYYEQQTAIRLLLEQYADRFFGERPVVFHESLARVQEELAQARKTQDEERQELDKLQRSAELRLHDIAQVVQLWNRHERTHRLDDPLLEAIALTHEADTDLFYRLRDRSEKVIEGLERQAAVIVEERRRVNGNRNAFKAFCAKMVRDVKLREMAERGVDHKESYAELQEFEAMMETSIQKANHIAELRMQTEDQKLQQYMAHIQTHLKQITSELRDLPKKTRVRTETGNKEIYSFQVPEWEEQVAKERIRSHLEWIIGQLDGSGYRNEQGEEQASAVRKDLEKWLDAKQLLQKVFQQASIRISCRKVTNDHQVTGAAYSWEESNRWSGGEKWSKNMTLFLGLLNYVAEKRQHIQSQLKRHRTVILDNPFGKASSDHVLSPVFYIAEQLGFQIIALTAHAEGKFLQDYFPVVYSCRLRTAAGGSGKQIVDPQLSIQQAYFHDHAPESMDRIGEVKQMELF